MGVAGVAAYVGMALFFIWNLKSAIVYYTWTRAAAEKDLLESPLIAPWGLHPSVVKTWTDQIIASYYDPKAKQAQIRTHMAASLLITVLLIFQLVPKLRRNFIWLHRWAGRFCIAFAVANLPIFWKLIMGFKLSRFTQYFEIPIWAAIPFFGIKGWLSARNKDIQSHRSSMIMFSSCFFFFGVQRLCILFVQAVHSLPATREHLPLGDISKVQGTDYWEVCFGSADVLAALLTFGVGAYNAYGPRIKTKSA